VVEPKLLFVGGQSRSGSTLLGRALGEAEGSVCVGETGFLVTRGLVENVQCGCGRPFRDCAFWSAVGDEAFAGWDRVDLARLVEIDRLASRFPTLPFEWSVRSRAKSLTSVDHYVSWLNRLYSAIAEVSGATVVVETSKAPWFASILMRMPDCDVRLLHLVRDSRAVAYSWTRRTAAPSPAGEEKPMPRFRPADTAKQWVLSNASLHLLARRASAYTNVNYESFVTHPHQALRELSAFAGCSLGLPQTQLTNDAIRLGDHHIFSGNPMRWTSGWQQMRVDEEWRTALPAREFAAVTAMTWPLLKLYGYRTSRSTRRDRVARIIG
jgi:hypothetical protein